MLPATFQFIIAMIACSINERLLRKLDHAPEEVLVLKDVLCNLGYRRIPFTADHRRRLAMAGKELSPEERRRCCQLVRAATLLAWFRQLGVRKYDSSVRRTGRPRKTNDIRKLVISMAKPSWGYTKIRDALRTGLKVEIGRTTVANILAEAGLDPASERESKRIWKQFIRTHRDSLYACDSFSVEVLGLRGTVRYMVFFVIEIRIRSVEIVGIGVNPDGEWMSQMARNLTDPVDGFLRNAKYLIHDRDPLFTDAFEAILRPRGIKGVKIPVQSPNRSPYAERFVETIRHECLNYVVFFGERHLRYVVKEFMVHYHAERLHQGLGGQLAKKEAGTANDNRASGKVACRSRLGGIVNFYYREAA